MAFNSAHAAITLGFLLLMASEAYVYGFCHSPSGSFRGPCFSDYHCKIACEREYYKGDKSKPFTDGKCSNSGSRRLDGVGYRWSLFPTCICYIFCGSEQDNPETHHHHPPPPSEDPEPSPPHHHAPPPHHHHHPPPPSEGPEPSPPHHHALPPHHHHHPPPPQEQEPPAQDDE